MERETGFEPAPPTLARSCSPTELSPPASGTVAQLRNPNHLAMIPELRFQLPSGSFGCWPDTLRAHDSPSVPGFWYTAADPGRTRPAGHEVNSSPTPGFFARPAYPRRDRKSTRLNSSHGYISYAVFCLKKKKTKVQK